ncbi:MAG: YWFCY domain-containing protein [Prevotella sp.]|nr:YWFCY domain-containing protein [Prevotella sp.]
MMSQEDDLRALAKIMDLLRAVSIVLVVMNIYWYCYEAVVSWGVNIAVVDKILLNFDRTAHLFHSVLYTKLFAALLLALSCLGTKGVKGEKITWSGIWTVIAAGAVLFFFNWWILTLPLPLETVAMLYIFTIATGYICLMMGGLWMSRLLKYNLMDDVFNNENESFMQETRLLVNDYSVNLPTRFYYRKKWRQGWINVVNPFRATIVLGTPGSGKSYAVVNNFIKQQIEKGFSQYIYDFKFPDLSMIAYNHLMNHPDGYKVKPRFYVINFDDPRRSHRCNPIHPDFMTDISDAYESAYTIMLNLNKTWVQKQGDFFVESPIILFAAIIWYLKIYRGGKYCTFPHAIEFLNRRYEDIFPILTSYPELENYLSPFMDAWIGGAADQLQGQIASAKIPLSRMISPQLYWVMSDSEFTLDINNPDEPKILCVGNNPDRQNIYGAALGLYNSRIVKLINKKGMLKSSVIIDELPTIYFKGLDNLIATARSNKVAVCLGFDPVECRLHSKISKLILFVCTTFQDFSQLIRDYGDKEAKVVMNTVGNIFSGQVVGETAKTLSDRFGKVLQKRQSISINRQDVSTSINTQMDSLIPPSKISGLTQGMFVGSVSDNFNERIEQKIFHAEVIVDNERVAAETKAYKPIPVITDFTDENGNDCMKERVQENYNRIKEEVKQIVKDELERIAGDENLKHLLQNKG